MFSVTDLVDDIKHVARLQMARGENTTPWLLKHPEMYTDAGAGCGIRDIEGRGLDDTD